MRHNYIIYDQCYCVNIYLSILDGFKILFDQIVIFDSVGFQLFVLNYQFLI
jgi:hypothetical protein